jgi:flagellar biosynthetic protein FliQ
MTPEAVLEVMHRAMWVALQAGGPVLAIGVGVGLLMAILQAATQISEPALTFVPKLGALALAMVWSGPWVLERLISFTRDMFSAIAAIGP